MKELTVIQSRLKAPKLNRNNFGGYNYRSCEDILEAVKPICHEMECYVTISDDIIILADRIYVKATATICNAEGKSVSVSAFAREEAAKKGMDSAQVTGAASSYARKYALNGLFAIDDTRDPDCENPADSAPKATATAKQAEPRKKVTDATLDNRETCDKLVAWAMRDYNRAADKSAFNAGEMLAKAYDVTADVKARFSEIFAMTLKERLNK